MLPLEIGACIAQEANGGAENAKGAGARQPIPSKQVDGEYGASTKKMQLSVVAGIAPRTKSIRTMLVGHQI